MNQLYNHIASLLGRLYYLPRMFGPKDLQSNVADLLADYLQQAEDILASALQKQGLAPEVARDSAFRYCQGVMKGLRDADALAQTTQA